MGKPLRDLNGQIFGRLTVLARVQRPAHLTSTGAYWLCRCDCGAEIIVIGYNLTKPRQPTRSCGCLHIDTVTRHGCAAMRTRIYSIWNNMLQRCGNPNAVNYSYYGAKGIKVCAEWMTFEPFNEWANANGHADGLELDRKKNDVGYEPDNCRFVTPTRNQRNKTTTRMVTFNGLTLPLTDWAERQNINPVTLATRLSRGWEVERALASPA